MKKPVNKKLLALVILINLLISAELVHFTRTGSDKAVLVWLFYYLLLLLLNLAGWLILDYFNQSTAKVFRVSTAVLIILALPLTLIAVL